MEFQKQKNALKKRIDIELSEEHSFWWNSIPVNFVRADLGSVAQIGYDTDPPGTAQIMPRHPHPRHNTPAK